MTWLKTLTRRAAELSVDFHTDHELEETVRVYYRDYYIPCLSSDLARDDARAVIEQQVLEMELPESVERTLMREIPEWLVLDRKAVYVPE